MVQELTKSLGIPKLIAVTPVENDLYYTESDKTIDQMKEEAI
jgi:hypothetical protein